MKYTVSMTMTKDDMNTLANVFEETTNMLYSYVKPYITESDDDEYWSCLFAERYLIDMTNYMLSDCEIRGMALVMFWNTFAETTKCLREMNNFVFRKWGEEEYLNYSKSVIAFCDSFTLETWF